MLPACDFLTDQEQFRGKSAGGLLKNYRPPAKKGQKRWWPAKKLQTTSTAAGIYDLRLLQIGRCGGLSSNGPPRARLLHGVPDFPIRRRRNFFIRCVYGSKVWTHIHTISGISFGDGAFSGKPFPGRHRQCKMEPIGYQLDAPYKMYLGTSHKT